MYAKAIAPESLDAENLDDILALGWFRMGQTIFTTHFLFFHQTFYSALWLRIALRDFDGGTSFRKLQQRNRDLEVQVAPFQLDQEREDLYLKYRSELPFEPSESLRSILGSETGGIFQSMEVTLRHKETGELIGLGVFDRGATAAAGIISVYDPAYKRLSPGRYLIYQKLIWCRQQGLDWFYPGYFAPGYPHFDYKLSIGRDTMEYLEVASGTWQPIQTWTEDSTPIRQMASRLAEVRELLEAQEQPVVVWKYIFYDANLYPELRELTLFDYPLFLTWATVPEIEIPVVVYSILENRFHLLRVSPAFRPRLIHEDDIFSRDILHHAVILLTTDSPEEVATAFLALGR